MTLPPSWKEVGLLDVCELNPRIQRPEPETPVTFFPKSLITELTGPSLNSSIQAYGETSRQGVLFKNGDVLIATRGRDAMQATIVSGLVTELGLAQYFLALRAGPQIRPAFLLHFIQQPWVQKAALNTNRGTQSQLSIPLSFFKNLSIPVPPLQEQDYLIQLLQKASLEPYQDALNKVIDLSDALALQLLVSGEKAQAWPRVKLSSICEFSPAGAHPKKYQGPSRTELFSPRSFDHITGQVEPQRLKLEELPPTCAEVQADDVLFTLNQSFRSRGIAFAVTPDEYATPLASAAFQVLRPNTKVLLANYLACFIRLSWLRQHVPASVLRSIPGRIYRSFFERLELPLPPLDQQKPIVNLLRKVPIERINDALETARRLGEAMLTEAFSSSLSAKWRAQQQTRSIAEPSPPRVVLPVRPEVPEPVRSVSRSARTTVAAQLSSFQSQVWKELSELPFPLVIDDQDAVEAFCHSLVSAQHQSGLSTVSLHRTLEQIAALGLIRKMSIPGSSTGTEGEFMTAFRSYRINDSGRVEEDSAMQDAKRFRDSVSRSNKGQ